MDFQELLIKTAQILDNLKVPYAVTGGYAVSVWGRVRSTLDIDVVIELFQPKITQLHKALKKVSALSYLEEQTMVEAVEQKSQFNFIHGESGLKIDFYISHNAATKLELQRRIPKIVKGQTVYFISPEDLILSKLLWHKESESTKQLEDIESVLAVQKDLDMTYLKKQSQAQSTAEILDSLLEKQNGK